MPTVHLSPHPAWRGRTASFAYSLCTVHWRQSRPGLTLVELLVVMGVFAIIFSFATINLLKPQKKASVDAAASTLVSDIKQQQAKAMASDSGGSSNLQDHGIYFENNRYTLFQGLSYQAANPLNFSVELSPNTIILNNLPSSQIVFSKNTGIWSNFNDVTKRIVIRNHNPSDPIPPPPTGPICQDVDINDDGAVSAGDILRVASQFPPAPYNVIYDINKDAKVNSNDSSIAAGFFAQTCPPQPQTWEQKTITVSRYGGIYIN